MHTSRLQRSTNAPLRDAASLKQYCDKHGIPCAQEFIERSLPTEDSRRFFAGTYKLDPLPPSALKKQGTSTIAIFEPKFERNNHGEVISAIARQVGSSLSPEVDALYVHASLNPYYRAAFQQDMVDSVKVLVENQGVPVLHTSVGWNDNLLDFNAGHDDQANHLWRVTAFVVDSAGNDGQYGATGKPSIPFQKHNALSHFAPLTVHVGATAMAEGGKWCIEGYSSANSPTFVAPVAHLTQVVWHEDRGLQNITGTSAAAPYASGVLAALNHRYGA